MTSVCLLLLFFLSEVDHLAKYLAMRLALESQQDETGKYPFENSYNVVYLTRPRQRVEKMAYGSECTCTINFVPHKTFSTFQILGKMQFTKT